MARSLDERAEARVRHRAVVDPESIHVHRVGRPFLLVVLVRPHPERAARDPDHAFRCAHPPPPPADILAIASSMVKLFGFWTAGNSLKVSVNFAAAY